MFVIGWNRSSYLCASFRSNWRACSRIPFTSPLPTPLAHPQTATYTKKTHIGPQACKSVWSCGKGCCNFTPKLGVLTTLCRGEVRHGVTLGFSWEASTKEWLRRWGATWCYIVRFGRVHKSVVSPPPSQHKHNQRTQVPPEPRETYRALVSLVLCKTTVLCCLCVLLLLCLLGGGEFSLLSASTDHSRKEN